MTALPNASNLLAAIVGPTGIGKTGLSFVLADLFECEIVSADSRLFYRGMDIGTDKPDPADRQRVRHHLIDIKNPDETITLGQYVRFSSNAISQIHKKNRLPLLVGGTGQYVKAVLEGWQIPKVPPNEPLRRELMMLDEVVLMNWLNYLDPIQSEKIDSRNKQRIIRALEVIFSTGQQMSVLQRKKLPDFRKLTIGLTCDREVLYKRIDDRVDKMMIDGLLEEVIKLRDSGYTRELPAMSALGYKQLWAHISGEISLEEAVERIKFETHRYVRQQYTWFSLKDDGISWFDIEMDNYQELIKVKLQTWLEQTAEGTSSCQFHEAL